VKKPAATKSPKPKVSLEETKDCGTNDDESDEDFVDSEEGESDDDEVGMV
jgi:hypothetical protein